MVEAMVLVQAVGEDAEEVQVQDEAFVAVEVLVVVAEAEAPPHDHLLVVAGDVGIHLCGPRLQTQKMTGWISPVSVSSFPSLQCLGETSLSANQDPPPRAKPKPPSKAAAKAAPKSRAKAAPPVPLLTPEPSGSRVPHSSSGAASEPDVNCNCGAPAGQRTVTKESANKGKRFYICETKTCDFFAWVDADGAVASGSGSGSSMAARMPPPSTIPVKRPHHSNGETERQCKCMLDAVQRTVQKEGPNKGRVFWTCPNAEEKRCGFFEWDDEPLRSSQGSFGGGSGAGASAASADECYKVINLIALGRVY